MRNASSALGQLAWTGWTVVILFVSANVIAGAAGAQSGPVEERGSTQPAFEPPDTNPQQRAITAYNAGVRQLERAKELIDKAAAEDGAKRDKLEKKARKAFESAVKELTAAGKLAPQNTAAHAWLGWALRRLGREEEAVAAFDRALAQSPDEVALLHQRAESYLALGRVQGATDSYAAIATKDPGRGAALLAAIKAWAAARRADPQGVDGGQLDTLEAWIAEQESGG